MIVALLHPGAMGVSVAATLRNSGHRVRWLRDGRSAATAMRADEAGLEPCDNLGALLDDADAAVSVCPPAAALAVAALVAESGFAGPFIDANAVSPVTVRALHGVLGERLIDGAIIGPPAWRPGTTRLYLSGPGSVDAARWFAAGPLQAIAIEGPPGAASTLKMCYAAYTKGSSALLLAVRAAAEAGGVRDVLLDEWALSQPGLAERSVAVARDVAAKAWRFEGEMREIADTLAAAGLPDGFHQAAAECYARLAPLKDAAEADVDRVVAQLRGADS